MLVTVGPLEGLLIAAAVLLAALWIFALVDSIRRGSFGWFFALLFFPGIGLLVWVIVRPGRNRTGTD
jgi:hypothetical protein